MSDTLTTIGAASEGADLEARLDRVREGLLALEGRLSAARGELLPEDRAMLVTMVLALEDALREIEGPPREPGRPSATPSGARAAVAPLRTHLDDLAGRVLIASGGGRTAMGRHARSRIRLPWRRRPSGAGATAFRPMESSSAVPEKASTRPAPDAARRGSPWTLAMAGRIATIVGLVAALFVAYEFLLTGLWHERQQIQLLARFQQEVPTHTLGGPASRTVAGGPVALLQIPIAGVDEIVVEGTSPQDLKAGPGHLRDSPWPGEFGNAVVEAHRTTYGGPFRHLDRLQAGDRISVTTGEGAFTYVVTAVGRIRPGQPEPLTGTLDSRLTLVTSDPAFTASGRLVVVASLDGAPIFLPNRSPVPVGEDDLGLAGDPLGLGLALIWGQLLALVLFAGRRLTAIWSRPVVWLLATPVVLALAVLAFSSLDRMLPGTL